MRRDALSLFFQRVVLATLPLAAGCSTQLATGNSDLAGQIVIDGGIPDGQSCQQYCPPGQRCATATPTDAGTTVIQCFTDHTGRRPATLRASDQAVTAGTDGLGALFARMALLEAASVHAFRTLADELAWHGAPRALVAAATRAAADEIVHAGLTGRLARQLGAEPLAPEVDSSSVRPLAEVAVENAREGCVRESYGALVATWQARVAGDRRIQRAMAVIAVDETRHAELAWSVACWAHSRLEAADRERVAEARRAALVSLRSETERAPAAEWVARAGVPSRAQAAALYRAFASEVQRRAGA